MRRPHFTAIAAVAALGISMLALAPSASAAPSSNGTTHRNVHVCGPAAAGTAACDSIRHDTVTSSGKVAPAASAPIAGSKTPADIRSAYTLSGAVSGGKTVAIVDAYNAPTAEKDLGVYRSQFGLSACTKANGCFRQVNQTGGTSLPRNDGGWAQEISLDLDMVSAACPDCKILLVEAKTASFSNLGAAVQYAAGQGVVAISNSYGGSDSTNIGAYRQPGIAVTASTGDNGYGAQAPASFTDVIAVGGTSLNGSISSGWSETAWNGAGSGCSAYNAADYQNTGVTQCGKKANADVSAVADPNTGVAVYDSYAYQGSSGWMQFGGTSASSPIIASVYAQGTAVQPGAYPGAATWQHKPGDGTLNDVTSGSNGSCSTSVWCNAGTGWDGPTGLGTPHGTGAF